MQARVLPYFPGWMLLTILSFLCTPAARAQQGGPRMTNRLRISALIADSATGMPIQNALVEIRTAERDAPLLTVATDSLGVFLSPPIESLPARELLLRAPGYKDRSIGRVTLSGDSVYQLGTLLLCSRSILLDEVRVQQQKQLIEMAPGKIIYHVDADPESGTASAFDILWKIPFLSIGADDELQLGGSGQFRVLVNGRPSSLFVSQKDEVFKVFPAQRIRRIEIVLTPSVKYEAQGVSGILNIITYEKVRGGLNAGLSLKAGTPENNSVSASAASSTGRLDLSAEMSAGTTYLAGTRTQLRRSDKATGEQLLQRSSSGSASRWWNGNTEALFRLGAQSELSIAASFNKTKSTNVDELESLLSMPGAPGTSSGNRALGNRGTTGSDAAIEYTQHFAANPGQQLQLSGRLTNTAIEDESRLHGMNAGIATGKDNRSTDREHYQEWFGQASYEQPFGPWLLETGASITYREQRSDAAYTKRDSAGAPFLADRSAASDLRYREQLFAGYLSMQLTSGRLTLRAGLRAEKAQLEARFAESRTATRNSYGSLLPSLRISVRVGQQSNYTMSYARGLQRPAPELLNPYINGTDPFNISTGNPGLLPERTQVLLLQFGTVLHKTAVYSSFTAHFTNRAIQPISTLDSDRVTRSTYKNTGSSSQYLLSVGAGIRAGKIVSLQVACDGRYSSFSSGEGGHSSGLSIGGSGGAQLKWKDWRAGAFGNYSGVGIRVQGRSAAILSTSFSLQRAGLLKKRLTLGFTAANPFRKYRHSRTELEDAAFSISRSAYTLSRRFQASLQYRFIRIRQ
ncbi:MAG: TonB-dependent receptor [Chitinophagaceae bacterium]|nr:MAG: TonB-dependent receptor [Chitinophagaceae bacterium]